MILFRLVRRSSARTLASHAGPARCDAALAGLLALALVAGLAWAWWPHRGHLPARSSPTRAARSARWPQPPGDRAPAGLVAGPTARSTDRLGQGRRPSHPRAAAARAGARPARRLRDRPATDAPGTAATTAPSWVFPFNKPLRARPGDNQALAVNTTDNTDPVRRGVRAGLGRGRLAGAQHERGLRLRAAATTAPPSRSAFQVVLVTGDNHVAVPQNLSAAVNYDCVNCLTYALATQLFVTLDGPLSLPEHA